MKGILAAIICAIAIFFAVPMIAEGTGNTCKALEKRTVSDTATNIAGSNTGVVHDVINAVGQAGATGKVASANASEEYPNTPTPIACTYEYWQQLL